MTRFHEKIFVYGLAISYILYGIAFFGIHNTAPGYLTLLSFFLKVYVSIFLLVRFNPLRSTEMTRFDRRIVFSSAVFLLTTTVFNEIVLYYSNRNKLLDVNFIKSHSLVTMS